MVQAAAEAWAEVTERFSASLARRTRSTGCPAGPRRERPSCCSPRRQLSATQPLSEEALRRAAGSAVRQLAGVATVTLALPTTTLAEVAAVAEGAAMGAYSYTELRSSKDGLKDPVKNVMIRTDFAADKALQPVLDRASLIGTAVNATRTLVNQPPSHLYPESFADAAKELSKGLPVKVTVWDEKRLEKEGFGGILGVGKGSTRQPRLVKVEYAPAKATRQIALVGKGITFDTGGLSLKPAASHGRHEVRHGGCRVVLGPVLAARGLRAAGRDRLALHRREHALRRRHSARRRPDHVRRQDRRGPQHRRRGAPGPRRRPRRRQPGVPGRHHRRRHPHRRAAHRPRRPHRRRDGLRLRHRAIKAAADRAGELVWPMPLPDELRAQPRLRRSRTSPTSANATAA